MLSEEVTVSKEIMTSKYETWNKIQKSVKIQRINLKIEYQTNNL